MYLPHRYRRRLLLPPGWVTLGFLLWLGCLVVQGQWRRLRPANALQLTMPLLKYNDDSFSYLYTVQSARQDIYQVRHWQKLAFTGRASDSLVLRRVPQAIVALDDKTQPSKGLAIRLAGSTRYHYLVGTLDLVNQYNMKRNMLDIRQVPTTLYILGPYFQPRHRTHPMPMSLPVELR